MRFNISQLKDFLRCPRYAHNKHVLLRGIPYDSPALAVGTAFHAAMEQIQRGEALTVDLDLRGVNAARWAEAQRDWAGLQPIIRGWQPTGRIIQIEGALLARLGKHEVDVKPDAVIDDDGLWARQFKTTSASAKVEHLIEKVRLGFHECMYQEALHQHGMPVRGTEVIIARKLPGSRIIDHKRLPYTDEERVALGLFVTRVQRSPRDVSERLQDIEHWANLMEASPHPKNTDSCWGMFGNSECIYFDSCHRGMDIMQAPYVQLEQRYAAGEE